LAALLLLNKYFPQILLNFIKEISHMLTLTLPDNKNPHSMIKNAFPLQAGPWHTPNPFIFCVFHQDAYPEGNGQLGPKDAHNPTPGNDFNPERPWRWYHGNRVPGFPGHPHRGFETITIVNKGFVDHADSNGHAARYGEGDVQWMTAGGGLQHSEMFPLVHTDKPNTLELFQIWLNLPAKSKTANPGFKIMWDEEIPEIADASEQWTVRLIAGEFEGHKALNPLPDSWAATKENEVAIWEIRLKAHAQINLPQAPPGVLRTLYFFAGKEADLNGSNITSDMGYELDASQPALLRNGHEPARFLVLQGMPILEPVVAHGPFVMNSKLEIMKTFEDYQRTRFGGWNWPSSEPTHGPDPIRFAEISGIKTHPKNQG
jgi:quercetin 2,3-dioxygenase